MKDNKYNKNVESHKDMNEKHAQKGAAHMPTSSKSHKEMEEERTRRPQSKRGGRHCPNC